MPSITDKLNGGLARIVAVAMGDLGLLGHIRQDHAELATLLGKLARRRGDAQLYRTCAARLRAHARAEQEAFYGPLERARGASLLTEDPRREHALLEGLLCSLDRTPCGSDAFRAGSEQLHRAFAVHMRDEETYLFARARSGLSRGERLQLGRRFRQARRRALAAQQAHTEPTQADADRPARESSSPLW